MFQTNSLNIESFFKDYRLELYRADLKSALINIKIIFLIIDIMLK